MTTLPTLHVDDILLRAWQPADAAWYVEARDDDVYQWTTEKRTLTVDKAESAIRSLDTASGAYCFAIVDRETNDLLGNIALMREKADPQSAELMFWLAPEARGRGVATRASRCLCDWAFRDLDLDRITAKTFPRNERSQSVLNRLGFETWEPGPAGADMDSEWYVLVKQ